VSEFNEIFSASLSKFVVKTQQRALWNGRNCAKSYIARPQLGDFNLHNPVEEEHNSRLYILHELQSSPAKQAANNNFVHKKIK
jgi:hypothetical protein